ncbi:MAG: 50S ribosomal protein L5 [Methanothrix sp.]|nr:MAG: 50S ribosomal protein L5 [Methanothrix sp.]
MQEPRIDKVTVHIGVGEGGQRMVNAENILTTLTDHSPVRSVAKKTLPAFGIKKGEPMGCRLTLRGNQANEFLTIAMDVIEKTLRSSQFDDMGNFSFGIEEHTDFPGMRYDPDIGIFGMDVSVALKRPGYRVARRRVARRKLSSRHRLTKTDAIEFVKSKLDVDVVEAA